MCLIAKHYVESLIDAYERIVTDYPDQHHFACILCIVIRSLINCQGSRPYENVDYSVNGVKKLIFSKQLKLRRLPPEAFRKYDGLTEQTIDKFHEVLCSVVDDGIQHNQFAGLTVFKSAAIAYYEMYKLNLARQMYLPLTPPVTATELADVDKAWNEREYTHDDLEVFLMTLPHIPEAAPVVDVAPAAAHAPAAHAAVVAVVAAAPASKKRGRTPKGRNSFGELVGEAIDLNLYTLGVVGDKMPPKRAPKPVFRADFVDIDDCDL
jgi:hypothetical protein